MKNKKIQWHPAFVAAMDLELADDRQYLTFQKEYNLNTRPLQIDLLIEKKSDASPIENEIGKLFRMYNIVEYKSPADGLGIDDYYKSTAYAALFKAYGKTDNEIDETEVTLTLIRESKPEKLLHYFRERGYTVAQSYRGIYYIGNKTLFATQVIVSSELNSNAHVWLRALSGKLKKNDFHALLSRMECLTGKHEKEMADSVFQISVSANYNVPYKVDTARKRDCLKC